MKNIKLMTLKLDGAQKVANLRSDMNVLFKRIFRELECTAIEFTNVVRVDIDKKLTQITKLYYEELGDEILFVDGNFNMRKVKEIDLYNFIKLFEITCSIEGKNYD